MKTLNNIFIKKNVHAELFKKVEDGYIFKEAPRLLLDFKVGSYCQVGARFTRTFGNDWWLTTEITNIESITPLEKDKDRVAVIFNTQNSTYKLIVDKNVIEGVE